MPRSRIGGALLALVTAFGGGCRAGAGRTQPVPDAPAASPHPDAGTRTADMPRLPEDPEAGRRSEAQWRQHLDHEEHERQIAFDKRKLPEHRALLALLRAARARLDGARSDAAVKRLAGRTEAAIADARRRIQQLDHWGVNSRLLPDYDDMLRILDGEYAAARLRALAGQPAAEQDLRARWDRHLKAADDWLAEAAGAED